MTNLKNKTVSVNGKIIKYRTAGKGFPVILIHGLSGSTRWWKRNIDSLIENNHRVYLFDLPGFGVMRRKREKLALKEGADWVIAVLSALQIKKTDLIGHSMGGYICIQIAVLRPDMVKRLVLVSSVGIPSGRTILTSFIPLLIAARYATPSFFPVLATDALRAGPITLYRSAQDILRVDVTGDLAHISAPTLLLWGQNDSLLATNSAIIFHRKIAGSQLIILKKAGHVPMFDRPIEFNRAVEKFLK